jgi:hypothetical protein
MHQKVSDTVLLQEWLVIYYNGFCCKNGIVIYGPTRNVKGLLNDARIGTDAVIYPAWS